MPVFIENRRKGIEKFLYRKTLRPGGGVPPGLSVFWYNHVIDTF